MINILQEHSGTGLFQSALQIYMYMKHITNRVSMMHWLSQYPLRADFCGVDITKSISFVCMIVRGLKTWLNPSSAQRINYR